MIEPSVGLDHQSCTAVMTVGPHKNTLLQGIAPASVDNHLPSILSSRKRHTDNLFPRLENNFGHSARPGKHIEHHIMRKVITHGHHGRIQSFGTLRIT